MKEAVFILLVIFILFALTAVRYRRHITALIQMWRILKGARQRFPKKVQTNGQLPDRSLQLVNCSKCSRWVPKNEALRVGAGNYFCSRGCFEQSANVP